MLTKWLARQLRRPEGSLAGLVGRFMNTVNREMQEFTVTQMEVTSQSKVLDIGFGGGLALSLLAETAESVFGLEVSHAMLTRAQQTLQNLIAQGRLQLVRGCVESIPFADEVFDAICTVNTLYFWNDPAAALREIARVLKPDGPLVLTFRQAQDLAQLPFTRHGFRLYDVETMLDLLRQSGFTGLTTVSGRDKHLGFVCVTGRKGMTSSHVGLASREPPVKLTSGLAWGG